MENKLQEWIFDNLPGNISQNPAFKELRKNTFKPEFRFIFKATQSFYNKLCNKLGISNIPEIQIIDGRGDYMEFEFSPGYAGYNIKGIAKSNDQYSEVKVRSDIQTMDSIDENDLIIKNDGTFTLNYFQFSMGLHFRASREFDKNGKLINDYLEPKTMGLPKKEFCTFDVLRLPDLIDSLKEFIQINNLKEVNEKGNKILKAIYQNFITSGLDDKDKIILPMDFAYRLARLVYLVDDNLEKSPMEITFFLVERDNIFLKYTTILKPDKVEWIIVPITHEEAKKYYDSNSTNVTFDEFKFAIEGPSLT